MLIYCLHECVGPLPDDPPLEAGDLLTRDEFHRRYYVEDAPNSIRIIESVQFPGLRRNVPALLRGDLAAVLAEVQP